jgi:hypothetical protein
MVTQPRPVGSGALGSTEPLVGNQPSSGVYAPQQSCSGQEHCNENCNAPI